jgi:hypothetical protein
VAAGGKIDEVTPALLERLRGFAMPDGPVRARGTWLRQVGEMRFAPDSASLPFEAEETLEAIGVNFRWTARVRMSRFVRANVVDGFKEGRGFLIARWLGIVPLTRLRGTAVESQADDRPGAAASPSGSRQGRGYPVKACSASMSHKPTTAPMNPPAAIGRETSSFEVSFEGLAFGA